MTKIIIKRHEDQRLAVEFHVNLLDYCLAYKKLGQIPEVEQSYHNLHRDLWNNLAPVSGSLYWEEVKAHWCQELDKNNPDEATLLQILLARDEEHLPLALLCIKQYLIEF